MNPALPLPLLIPTAVILTALVAWLSWIATRSLDQTKRRLLCTLRIVTTLALCALLINPGQWVQPTEQHLPPWLVLIDHSESMNQSLGESTRFQNARQLAEQTLTRAKQVDTPIEIRPFDTSAGNPLESLNPPSPANGKGSDLNNSLKQLLSRAAASGSPYSGILILSDGRQTQQATDAELAALALRLRAHHTPLHAVAIGGDQAVLDLALQATRPTVTAFREQALHIPFAIQSKGLPPQKPSIQLLDEHQKEIANLTVELKPDQTTYGSFELKAPTQSARWTIHTPTLPNESIAGNNSSTIHVRLLESRTRVFLAEGAPYWDSKFLAQLLRQQSQIDLRSVHRLSEERYFQINTGDNDGTESTNDAIFPETAEALSQYDLVIFGKNTDAFLNPNRLTALRNYVRDQGGAILFSRGKPTTSHHPGLDPLEPVTWGNGFIRDFRFNPTADGAAASLFGQALPAPDASVWTALPPLKDARAITTVKPFSRILAKANPESSTLPGGPTASLIVRRYGQGVTGLVNGDGLWKWDFYPEARELGNMYEDFWMQLIQWMASYSEFLPGQDFSLRLSSDLCLPGETITATMSFRGTGEIPSPTLQITNPGGKPTTLQPAALTDAAGHVQWRASFTPDTPGEWHFKLIDPRNTTSPTPDARLTVPAPIAESDNLSPDPAFLSKLCTITNGKLLDHATFPQFLEHDLKTTSASSSTRNAIWKPSWLHWPLAIVLICLLTLEWLLRRRQGLA